MNANSIKVRIDLLKARKGKNNENIIRKLERKLRKIEE